MLISYTSPWLNSTPPNFPFTRTSFLIDFLFFILPINFTEWVYFSSTVFGSCRPRQPYEFVLEKKWLSLTFFESVSQSMSRAPCASCIWDESAGKASNVSRSISRAPRASCICCWPWQQHVAEPVTCATRVVHLARVLATQQRVTDHKSAFK